MIKNNFGSMVHISSIDALSGDDKPQDAYGASKAAMIRLSKSLAIQFGSFNIRSNCKCTIYITICVYITNVR